MSAGAERLRVLLFGRLADRDFGGLERHVRSLVDALEADVNYVNLVADRGVPMADFWRCPVVAVPSLGKLASVYLCPAMPLAARRLHREHRFHLAHLHLPDPMAHLAALALPADVPLVLTWHSDIVAQRLLLGPYRPFLRRLVARAAAVIAPTPAHFTSMPQLAALTRPAQRVTVPFGFDLSGLSRPHPKRAALRAEFGPRVVFSVGRHVYYKGLDYLLRAMADLPDTQLVIGGSGPLTARLRQSALELGVATRVRFVGRIPDEDLAAYYQACDVFCLPSVDPSEAFGIVQLEAMACAKPVVSCELHNGVTWVNRDGETGLVVPPRAPRALAAALERLLADAALRARLGASGARRAQGEFSLAALREQTLAVYQGAIDAR
ncbi:MAG: glycosyltransferase [Betaproteobacteria bacterium]|nr:glycosyltransferase [Betaproteobacteria bacterium]